MLILRRLVPYAPQETLKVNVFTKQTPDFTPKNVKSGVYCIFKLSEQFRNAHFHQSIGGFYHLGWFAASTPPT